jgi:hypothetical protein
MAARPINFDVVPDGQYPFPARCPLTDSLSPPECCAVYPWAPHLRARWRAGRA